MDWVSAEVTKILDEVKGKEQKILALTEEGEEMEIPISKAFLKNPDILEGVDDLASLSFLHEPAILHNLHHR